MHQILSIPFVISFPCHKAYLCNFYSAKLHIFMTSHLYFDRHKTYHSSLILLIIVFYSASVSFTVSYLFYAVALSKTEENGPAWSLSLLRGYLKCKYLRRMIFCRVCCLGKWRRQEGVSMCVFASPAQRYTVYRNTAHSQFLPLNVCFLHMHIPHIFEILTATLVGGFSYRKIGKTC